MVVTIFCKKIINKHDYLNMVSKAKMYKAEIRKKKKRKGKIQYCHPLMITVIYICCTFNF